MSVMKDTAAAFSRSCRKIFYLVSDDYNIIQRFIENSPAVFAQRMRNEIDEGYFLGPGTYKRLSARYIEDCHYIMQPSLFVNDDAEGKLRKQSGQGDKAENRKQKKYKVKDTARIFICQDFHLLKEAEQGRLLKQFLDYSDKKQGTQYLLLLSAPILALPRGYEQVVEAIDMPGPDEEDIGGQLLSYADRQCSVRKEKLDDGARKRIKEAAGDFRGLNYHEIEAILYEMTGRYGSFYGRSAAQKHMPTDDDFKEIAEERQKRVELAKKEKASKDSTVSILESGDQIAGFGRYKEWLRGREDTIKNPVAARKRGREPIRGVLMTGLPGTGKTQGAKYTAHQLGVPLVQMRIDNLLGGLVGDSEKNFKRYRKQVEMLAPCVVLIDEIEKLFSDERGGSGGSSEVKMNIFAALLDWMQDNKKGIFFYATCNSVKNLPPELLRDGRFSMRFCVFMPTYSELVEIIRHHMKRGNDLSGGKTFCLVGEIVDVNGDISPKAAEQFLDNITVYGKESKRDMFFTGANIEALINEVQYHFSEQVRSAEKYAEAMCDIAKGEFCQPYGETNLNSAVEFWIDALENNFTDAAGYGKDKFEKDRQTPLSFRHFDRQRGVFRDDGFDNDDKEYDRCMYEAFKEKIQQVYEKRKG